MPARFCLLAEVPLGQLSGKGEERLHWEARLPHLVSYGKEGRSIGIFFNLVFLIYEKHVFLKT